MIAEASQDIADTHRKSSNINDENVHYDRSPSTVSEINSGLNNHRSISVDIDRRHKDYTDDDDDGESSTNSIIIRKHRGSIDKVSDDSIESGVVFRKQRLNNTPSVGSLQIEKDTRCSNIPEHNHRRRPETVPVQIEKQNRESCGDFSVRNETNRKLASRNSGFTKNCANNNKSDRARVNIGSKNGNMVLQLVLPSGSQSNLDNNYLSNSSLDEILGTNKNKQRKTNSFSSQQDLYTALSNSCFTNEGYANDLADYAPESMPQTPAGVPGSDENCQKSTSAEEKNRIFRDHLTLILSSMYAVFIVTLGLVVYISDIVVGNSPIAETFSLYLVIVALLYVVYLTTDITIYMKKKSDYNNLKQINIGENIEMKSSANDNNFQLNITLPKNSKMLSSLKHHYCLNKDRHSANFFLKIGAAGFCLGHLIHSGLLLGYQIVFLTSEGAAFYECATVATLILDFVYPLYSFILLYFIFKYSNIIINRNMALARFGLMHCISSSLCFWVWTILRETIEALSNKQYEDDHHNDSEIVRKIPEIAFYAENNNQQPIALPLTAYNEKGARVIKSYLNASVRQLTGFCAGDERLTVIYRNFSPYLYPFSVEYSILVVGVLFVIWQSIGKCREQEEISSCRQCDSPEGNDDNLESNVVIHADCHSANNGLFGGIVIMVIAVVSIILFFIAINDVALIELGIFVNRLTSVVILLLMSITVILAYRQLTKLDVNTGHISLLDDLLLFVCIPAYFLNTIFSIIPAILFQNALNITLIVTEVTQVLLQTPLIIDGLRRSSNSRDLRREKPGRELLTFLLICNVALWLTQTFEVKSHGLEDERYEFYGKELWTIIGHMCIPLMMFYRFHSAVCIADIWKHAYEEAEH